MRQVGWASASSTRDVLELVSRAAAERAAGGSEDDRVDGVARASLEALEDGAVLGVDRQQQASSPLLRAQRELAGGDEALLVRERERDPALQRPQRGADAGEAHDGVEDDVRLGRLEQPGQLAADLDVLDGMGGREPESRCEPDASAQSSRPGCLSMTAIAWRADRARLRQAARLASRSQCTNADGLPVAERQDRRRTLPRRRRGARRRGRACRRARRGGVRSPSPSGHA